MPISETFWPRHVLLSDLIGPFGSVAIIGNSPVLLQQEHGASIDAHDAVIRINDGRTLGYERHSGTKTTLRFVGVPLKPRYHEFFQHLDEGAAIATLADNRPILEELGWSGKLAIIEDYRWIARNAFPRLTSVIPLEDIPAKRPRTGILLLSMLTDAMKAGKRITLFGFETEERSTGKEHFFEDNRKFDTILKQWDKYHCPMSYEFSTIQKLAGASLIEVN